VLSKRAAIVIVRGVMVAPMFNLTFFVSYSPR